jgi:SAM-dependent methyltransferase
MTNDLIAAKVKIPSQFSRIFGIREQRRDWQWLKRDRIYGDRLLWSAQTFRHVMHLLPGQTILELGAGQGLFTQRLYKVSRGENPITAVTFTDNSRPLDLPDAVDFINLDSIDHALSGRQFDFIVAVDLLDKSSCGQFLQSAYELLAPGGQVLLYESNPWNFVLKMRRFCSRFFNFKPEKPRQLLNRTELYELVSELGFVRIFAVYNDFVYAPFHPRTIWVLRNLSVLLENLPRVQTLASSILLHAQKPPRTIERPQVSLFEHKQLRKAVSVVIPCHNEEMNIEPLVTRLKALYGEYLYEIVLVDDNSRDRTRDVIGRLAATEPLIKPVYRQPPNGVGRAIADGYKASSGQYVLSMDCDFQHLLPELRDLFDAAAQGYDVVVGSRFSRHSVLLNYPFQKILMNRGFHLLARILLMRQLRDLTNNLKLMRREVIEDLRLTQPGFAINAETGLQPLLMGYSVREVPISWINRTPDMGVSSFKLIRVGGGYWQVLLKLWLETLSGKIQKRRSSHR